MLCIHCRSLPAPLRRHPRGPLPTPAAGPLGALVCARCGSAACPPRPWSLPETLQRLERVGLGIAGPLLRGGARAA